MKKLYFSIFIAIVPFFVAQAQVGNDFADKEVLVASTKQVNQFFRRFNLEEDWQGNRLRKDDPLYRNNELRKKTIAQLFDMSNSSISNDIKRQFIEDVTNPASSNYLTFWEGEWFAEAHCKFMYNGKVEDAILYMKLEEENKGIKWVISDIYFEPFFQIFDKDPNIRQKYLHPMSHELDFMNLKKNLKEREEQDLADNSYKPHYLTVFFYELKKGNLKFLYTTQTFYHFFQVDNWYFKIEEFNRSTYNSGWLIADLLKISQSEKNLLLKNIYHD